MIKVRKMYMDNKLSIEEIKERMHNGKLYFCSDKHLLDEQVKYLDKVFEYNNLKPSEENKKQQLLKEMFAYIGEGCHIETPFYASWGGKFVHFGNSVYANFNLTMVDDCEIYVGDNTMFGPNVTLATAGHPVHPELRKRSAQYNLPIKIGNNVWIGANSVVLPGVNIGDNSIIGAGSIVTKDIPPNVVAVGNPCRIMREVGKRDMEYYYKDMKIDI